MQNYFFRNVGRKCYKVVKNAENVCRKYSDSDFIKLSVFGTFVWNWTPLETMARECNSRALDAFKKCQGALEENVEKTKFVNFILTDFPNYPGKGRYTIVEIADSVNAQRAKNIS